MERPADKIYDVLKRYWGFTEFRPVQERIIRSVMDGRDTLALMPTGGGKSLTYQIPGLAQEGLCIVVTPLIALMKDQVDRLRARHIPAVAIHSGLSPRAIDIALDNCVYGDVKFLYVAPERLATEAFRLRVVRMNVSLVAVDEAHCISQWGYDFRPSYLRIAELREKLPGVPVLALTASATKLVAEDIMRHLRFAEPHILRSSFARPNLSYSVRHTDDKNGQLLRLVRNVPGSGIVYVRTREGTEQVADMLRREGITAAAYHGGMGHAERSLRQEEWVSGRTRVMVATNAFGMGIDKPDVRFVAHLDMPKSIENYFQETGRAGRDGKPADAWMAYGLIDAVNQRRLMEMGGGDEMYARLTRTKLEAMLALAETAGCRRQMILRYFGEESGPCGNCDNCLEPPKMQEVTEDAKRLVSCIWRVNQAGGTPFGANYIVQVLQGELTDRILLNGHDKLSTFGIGKHLSAEEWRRILRQLIARDIVRVEAHNMGGLTLGQARGLLKGDEQIFIRSTQKPAKRRRRVFEELTGEDLVIFERLKQWRREKASETGKLPYQVFNDATLEDIVRLRPVNSGQLAQASGVGEVKLERYGREVLQIIREYIAPGKRA